MQRGHDQTDRSGVNVTELVPADDLVRRADVGARSTANAVQRVTKFVVVARRPPPVVQQDDVEFLRTVNADG